MQHLFKATKRTEAVSEAIQEATNLPDWLVYLITDDAVSMEQREINQVVIPFHVNTQKRLRWLTILPSYIIAPHETRQFRKMKDNEGKFWRDIKDKIIRAPWLMYHYLALLKDTRTMINETISAIEGDIAPKEFKYDPTDLE